MNMKHWFMLDLQDRNQFRYYWESGKYNEADCRIKYFSAARHREKSLRYQTPHHALNALRAVLGKSQHIFYSK